MKRTLPDRRRGFTLVEIMIVTLIVAILTGLAAFVIGRIKDRAARSLIQNNLRQYYQAKEFFYAESGSGQPTSITVLMREGYLTKSAGMRMMNIGSGSLEGRAGWHYYWLTMPNQPVFAYRGRLGHQGEPLDEAIFYPGKGDTTHVTPPPAQTPPDATNVPPAVNNGPASGTAPDAAKPAVLPPNPQANPQPGDAAVNGPAVSQPPGGGTPTVAPGGTPAVNPGQAKPPQPPQPHQQHGPGNSDFGHSHGKGKG